MLLRDFFRGVSTLAETTEGIVEPALPESARRPLHAAIRAFESGSARILGPRVDSSDIRIAAKFVRGEARGLVDAEKCAKVLAFAWEETRPAEKGFRLSLSETIAAIRLATIRGSDNRCEFRNAAAMLLELRQLNLARFLPALPFSPAGADARAFDSRLFTYFVWLLAEREDTIENELGLLNMAMALASEFSDEVDACIGDRGELAALMENLANHL